MDPRNPWKGASYVSPSKAMPTPPLPHKRTSRRPSVSTQASGPVGAPAPASPVGRVGADPSAPPPAAPPATFDGASPALVPAAAIRWSNGVSATRRSVSSPVSASEGPVTRPLRKDSLKRASHRSSTQSAHGLQNAPPTPSLPEAFTELAPSPTKAREVMVGLLGKQAGEADAGGLAFAVEGLGLTGMGEVEGEEGRGEEMADHLTADSSVDSGGSYETEIWYATHNPFEYDPLPLAGLGMESLPRAMFDPSVDDDDANAPPFPRTASDRPQPHSRQVTGTASNHSADTCDHSIPSFFHFLTQPSPAPATAPTPASPPAPASAPASPRDESVAASETDLQHRSVSFPSLATDPLSAMEAVTSTVRTSREYAVTAPNGHAAAFTLRHAGLTLAKLRTVARIQLGPAGEADLLDKKMAGGFEWDVWELEYGCVVDGVECRRALGLESEVAGMLRDVRGMDKVELRMVKVWDGHD